MRCGEYIHILPRRKRGALMTDKSYIAIDLKSFYASVERGLDPVVADESRTAKTNCLAATPTLKSYDVKGV